MSHEINSKVYHDIECKYCGYGALGVKELYIQKLQEYEPNWYFCLNCGVHLFSPPQEKMLA